MNSYQGSSSMDFFLLLSRDSLLEIKHDLLQCIGLNKTNHKAGQPMSIISPNVSTSIVLADASSTIKEVLTENEILKNITLPQFVYAVLNRLYKSDNTNTNNIGDPNWNQEKKTLNGEKLIKRIRLFCQLFDAVDIDNKGFVDWFDLTNYCLRCGRNQFEPTLALSTLQYTQAIYQTSHVCGSKLYFADVNQTLYVLDLEVPCVKYYRNSKFIKKFDPVKKRKREEALRKQNAITYYDKTREAEGLGKYAKSSKVDPLKIIINCMTSITKYNQLVFCTSDSYISFNSSYDYSILGYASLSEPQAGIIWCSSIKMLLSWSLNNSNFQVWDPLTFKMRYIVLRHESLITCAVDVPLRSEVESMDFIASASIDRKLYLWSVAPLHAIIANDIHELKANNNKLGIRRLYGHEYAIRSLAFAVDNSLLLGAGFDWDVCAWDPWTGTIQTKFIGHTKSIINVSLVYIPTEKAITMDEEGRIKLWALELGENGRSEELQSLQIQNPSSTFRMNDFTPAYKNGSTIACLADAVYFCNLDGDNADEILPIAGSLDMCESMGRIYIVTRKTITHTRLRDGFVLKRYNFKDPNRFTGSVKQNIIGYDDFVTAVCYDLLGKKMFLGTAEGHVLLYDSSSLGVLSILTISDERYNRNKSLEGSVVGLQFMNCDQVVVAAFAGGLIQVLSANYREGVSEKLFTPFHTDTHYPPKNVKVLRECDYIKQIGKADRDSIEIRGVVVSEIYRVLATYTRVGVITIYDYFSLNVLTIYCLPLNASETVDCTGFCLVPDAPILLAIDNSGRVSAFTLRPLLPRWIASWFPTSTFDEDDNSGSIVNKPAISLANIIHEINSSNIPSMRTPLKSIRCCHYKLEENFKRRKTLIKKLKESVQIEVEEIKEKKNNFRHTRKSKNVEKTVTPIIAKSKLRQTLPEDENNYWNIVAGDDMGRLFIMDITDILIKIGVLWTENRPKVCLEKFSHYSPYENFELKTNMFTGLSAIDANELKVLLEYPIGKDIRVTKFGTNGINVNADIKLVKKWLAHGHGIADIKIITDSRTFYSMEESTLYRPLIRQPTLPKYLLTASDQGVVRLWSCEGILIGEMSEFVTEDDTKKEINKTSKVKIKDMNVPNQTAPHIQDVGRHILDLLNDAKKKKTVTKITTIADNPEEKTHKTYREGWYWSGLDDSSDDSQLNKQKRFKLVSIKNIHDINDFHHDKEDEKSSENHEVNKYADLLDGLADWVSNELQSMVKLDNTFINNASQNNDQLRQSSVIRLGSNLEENSLIPMTKPSLSPLKISPTSSAQGSPAPTSVLKTTLTLQELLGGGTISSPFNENRCFGDSNSHVTQSFDDNSHLGVKKGDYTEWKDLLKHQDSLQEVDFNNIELPESQEEALHRYKVEQEGGIHYKTIHKMSLKNKRQNLIQQAVSNNHSHGVSGTTVVIRKVNINLKNLESENMRDRNFLAEQDLSKGMSDSDKLIAKFQKEHGVDDTEEEIRKRIEERIKNKNKRPSSAPATKKILMSKSMSTFNLNDINQQIIEKNKGKQACISQPLNNSQLQDVQILKQNNEIIINKTNSSSETIINKVSNNRKINNRYNNDNNNNNNNNNNFDATQAVKDNKQKIDEILGKFDVLSNWSSRKNSKALSEKEINLVQDLFNKEPENNENSSSINVPVNEVKIQSIQDRLENNENSSSIQVPVNEVRIQSIQDRLEFTAFRAALMVASEKKPSYFKVGKNDDKTVRKKLSAALLNAQHFIDAPAGIIDVVETDIIDKNKKVLAVGEKVKASDKFGRDRYGPYKSKDMFIFLELFKSLYATQLIGSSDEVMCPIDDNFKIARSVIIKHPLLKKNKEFIDNIIAKELPFYDQNFTKMELIIMIFCHAYPAETKRISVFLKITEKMIELFQNMDKCKLKQESVKNSKSKKGNSLATKKVAPKNNKIIKKVVNNFVLDNLVENGENDNFPTNFPQLPDNLLISCELPKNQNDLIPLSSTGIQAESLKAIVDTTNDIVKKTNEAISSQIPVQIPVDSGGMLSGVDVNDKGYIGWSVSKTNLSIFKSYLDDCYNIECGTITYQDFIDILHAFVSKQNLGNCKNLLLLATKLNQHFVFHSVTDILITEMDSSNIEFIFESLLFINITNDQGTRVNMSKKRRPNVLSIKFRV